MRIVIHDNHLRHFESENVFQTLATLQGKTLKEISLKNRRFHEKKLVEIDVTAGTHTEAHY